MVASLVIATTLCCSNVVRGNELRVGVSFNLSTNGRIELKSMRPWLSVQIDKSTPTAINRFRAAEMHHGYVGAFLYGVGHITHVKMLRVVGGVLIIDDTIQHVFRVNSPVHMLNDELYQYNWYRSLINLGDKIIGPDKQ
jgi:hypothetical protein